jgi:hypothetical protein
LLQRARPLERAGIPAASEATRWARRGNIVLTHPAPASREIVMSEMKKHEFRGTGFRIYATDRNYNLMVVEIATDDGETVRINMDKDAFSGLRKEIERAQTERKSRF